MKLYKSPDNQVYAFEADGSQDHLILKNFVAITEEEANVIRKAQANKIDEDYFNSLSYAQKRSSEYPPMADYLDGIVKGDQSQIDAYIAACKAVKNKYPKE
jgi:hypothetical protein